MTVRETFDGSDGEATKALYARLEALGVDGIVALNLFRAQKCSTRAKVYSRRYKADAYGRKNWSLTNLCQALAARDVAPFNRHIPWGWKRDPMAEGPYCWVLYVELVLSDKQNRCSKPGCGYGDGEPCIGCGWIVPTSQVSFHAATRGPGPDYAGEWDKTHLSVQRILNYCEDLLGEPRTTLPPVKLSKALEVMAHQPIPTQTKFL